MAERALRIELLGGFRLTSDGRPVTDVRTVRQQSLLAYLLLTRHQPQSRQRIAFVVWPDSTEAQALTNLRRELHHLRRALPNAERFLDVEGKVLRWRTDAPFTFDVAEFEDTLACAYATQPPARGKLEEAVALCHGDLLPECYDEWILPERERLRQRYHKALEDLAEALEYRREFAAAIRHARGLLQLDPLREATYRRLMRLYALSGERAAALHVYHTCVTVLRHELGAEPDPATQDMYRRLLEVEAGEVRPPGLAASFPLVGREQEWQRLLSIWHGAANGHAQLAIISGEAGIGKTRLGEELLAWCAGQGIAAARTRAYATEGRLAYAPITDWLRSEALRPALPRLEPIWLAEIARLLPELLTERPDLPHPEPLTEGWQRRRFFEALARTVLAAGPLLLLIDDLQWCDRDTLEWLHYLLRFDPRARLLMVGTLRTEEQVDNPALAPLLLELRNLEQLEEIELGPLGEDGTVALAQHVAERTLDAQARADLFRQTEGHPLFVIEIARAGLPLGDDALRRPGATALPPKVQAVIAARLTQLTLSTRELAHLAAAIGRDFGFELLREASDLDEAELVRALDELWQRRIVREHSGDAYDFSHDRIREVAYAEVSPPRRRLLHRRIAQALEILHASDLDRVSAHLAAHWEHAGQPTRAIEFYERAARMANNVCASEEAIRDYGKALALLQQLPQSLERDRRELDLHLALTSPLNAARGYAAPELESVLERVRVLGERFGDAQAVVRCLWGLWAVNFVRGNIRRSLEIAGTLHELTERKATRLSEGRHAFGGSLTSIGALERGLHMFEQAVAHHDFEHHHPSLYGSDLGVFTLAWQAHTLWLSGYPDRARERSLRAIALAERFGHPYSQALAYAHAVVQFQLRRDLEAIWRYADALLEICGKYGFAYYGEWGRIIRGWAVAETSPGEGAVAEIRRGMDNLRAIGAETRRPYYLSLLAWAHARAAQMDQAGAVLDAALATAAGNHDLWWSAELHRLKGEFGQPDAAEAWFGRALEIARSQSSRSLELRAAASLARLWAARGQARAARDLLAPIYARFTEGLDTPDLLDARAILDGLDRPTPNAGANGLRTPLPIRFPHNTRGGERSS
ncbi:MAG: BTAD domain-containing putative transcriptional regulator [Armatimonadota bacterium]|nr:BTAD domain-containing putative transcriptional regulator [Armatimonadota bacterium]